MDDADLGRALLTIARSAIAEKLGWPDRQGPHDDALQQCRATFVTLKHGGELRGCVGSVQAIRPLGDDVRENAIAAAFRDPRFAPLQVHEFKALSVEVSLLNLAEPIAACSEIDLLERLRPGVDGLILEYGSHRATFLPQVWETLGEPREFLAALKRKAGLPGDFWTSDLNISLYTALKWAEPLGAASEPHR